MASSSYDGEVNDVAEARYFLRGEIDLAERDRVRCELAMALTRPNDLLVDCRDLTFLDSSGVAVLVDVRQELEAAGYNMLLVNVTGPPRRVLEVLGLTDWLSIERRDQSKPPVTASRDRERREPAPAQAPGPRRISKDAIHIVDLRERPRTGQRLNGVG